MRLVIDIETVCNVAGCPTIGKSYGCDHAVHFIHNKISLIGTYDGTRYLGFTELDEFIRFYQALPQPVRIIGHGTKFDLKSLRRKGVPIPSSAYAGDTLLAASVVRKKIPADFLAEYNRRRAELNKALPVGQRHRLGTQYSLKTLGPYYLDVDPFWENTENHSDEEYNRKDVVYTWRLYHLFLRMMKEEGSYEFYKNKLLPWNRMLMEAEEEGILVDVPKLRDMYTQGLKDAKKLERQLQVEWKAGIEALRERKIREAQADSEKRCQSFIEKRIKDPTKIESVKHRYLASLHRKVQELRDTPLNINSAQQVQEVLEYYGVDTVFEIRDKELNEWIEKESAGKYVLKRAKVRHGSPHVQTLLKFREKETENKYLKNYLDAVVDGRIHCHFNGAGTRTGRLSCADPNLQNVKGILRIPFLVADGDLFDVYTVDASQIEPRLIAYFSEDRELVLLFRNGRDFHNYATKRFFPKETRGCAEKEIKKQHEKLRRTAKTGDLSILYGTGGNTFSAMLLLREEIWMEPSDCKALVGSFRSGMAGVLAYKERLDEALEAGHQQFNILGRPVHVDIDKVYMTGLNTLIQGSASDLILEGSRRAREEFIRLGIDAKPLLWVHDEVVWRIPKAHREFCVDRINHHMKNYKLDTKYGVVPLDVEGHVADRWQK